MPSLLDLITTTFPPSEWGKALYITYHENGGHRANAVYNTSDPSKPGYTPPGANALPEYSVGLFQINADAHPDLARRYNLFDPLANVQAAYEIWQASGWAPWSTARNMPDTVDLSQFTDAADVLFDADYPNQPGNPPPVDPGAGNGGGGGGGGGNAGSGPFAALAAALFEIANGARAIGAAAAGIADGVKRGVDMARAGVAETVAFVDWIATPYAWERIILVMGGLATILLGLGLFGLSFVSQDDLKQMASAGAKLAAA
jgi:hypothetical protein